MCRFDTRSAQRNLNFTDETTKEFMVLIILRQNEGCKILPWEVAKIIEKTSRLFVDHHHWWWVAHSLPPSLPYQLLASRIFLPTTRLVPTPSTFKCSWKLCELSGDGSALSVHSSGSDRHSANPESSNPQMKKRSCHQLSTWLSSITGPFYIHIVVSSEEIH